MSSKEKILELLTKNKDQYVSGEAIASELGISRNAIWKAMNDLRSAGYIIDAVKNKGYCLSSKNDIISVPDIKSYLNDSLSLNIQVFDSVDSTNRLAKELAISGAAHGTAIIADHQTGGVAHNKESFSSPTGGIYMSIILDPEKMTIKAPSAISAFSAVSVCNAIESTCDIKPSIRLITDIFDGDTKLAGILNESAFDLETEKLQWIVVGIGIPNKIAATRNQLIAAIINNLLDTSVTKDAVIESYSKLKK